MPNIIESPARALAFLLVAAACACTATPPDDSCTRNADCATGELCQGARCVPVPCGGRCDSDEVCVDEKCETLAGFSCRNDASVCGDDFTCSPAGVCQRACTIDDECTDPGAPVCNVDTGFCGDCAFDADCTTAGKTFCDTTSARCVACIDARGCQQNGSPTGNYCDLVSNTCKPGCHGNAECPIGQRCEGGSTDVVGRCIECKPDATPDSDPRSDRDCDIADPRLRCEPQSLQCVECLKDAHCPTGNRCDLRTHTCEICLENRDCDFGRYPDGRVCEQTTQTCIPGCVGGLGGVNCPGTLPACDTTTNASQPNGRCVECLQDSHCPTAGKVCDLASKRCVPGCTDDSRCATNGTRKFCEPQLGQRGTCVECRISPNPGTGVVPADCAGTKVCHQSGTHPIQADANTAGRCRCKGVGDTARCGSNVECGFSRFSTSGVDDCGTLEAGERCITKVKCGSNERSIPVPFCSDRSSALPEQQQQGTCPSGWVTDDGADSSGAFQRQCVPIAYSCP